MERVFFVARWLLVTGVVCGALARCAVAHAQTETSVQATSTDDVARGLFHAGRASYGVGKYEDALKYFQQAYELSQRPGLLYNIGQAADRLHRDTITVSAFRQFLERVPQTEHRTEVESRLRALERLVEFESTQADAPAVTETSVGEGAPQDRAASETGGPGAAPWVLIAGGGVTLVTGAVLGWLGARQIAEVEDAAEGSRWADVESSADSGPTLATVGVVLMSVGALSSTAGVVWLLGSSADSNQASVAISVHPTGLSLVGAL